MTSDDATHWFCIFNRYEFAKRKKSFDLLKHIQTEHERNNEKQKANKASSV